MGGGLLRQRSGGASIDGDLLLELGVDLPRHGRREHNHDWSAADAPADVRRGRRITRRGTHTSSLGVAKCCQSAYGGPMGTMNISLPDALKSFVDQQVGSRGYGTSSEYVRELIRRDRDRQHLRGLLLEGAESAPASTADDDCFDRLRERARGRQRA